MFHTVAHAGNVLLVRTLESLAAAGCELCDIQTPTDHTMRLGAVQLGRAEFERRLGAALGAS
jgi:leucyl/phenylalanyl-tRNA--protein transferase